MIIKNCFGTLAAPKVEPQAILITALLFGAMAGYKRLKKKKLSPIMLIVISAVLGMLLY